MTERKKLLLRLDPDIYDAVARWAADDLRSVNAQIEYALRRALQSAGRARPGTRDQPPNLEPDPTPDVEPDPTPDVEPDPTPDVEPDPTPDRQPDPAGEGPAGWIEWPP